MSLQTHWNQSSTDCNMWVFSHWVQKGVTHFQSDYGQTADCFSVWSSTVRKAALRMNGGGRSFHVVEQLVCNLQNKKGNDVLAGIFLGKRRIGWRASRQPAGLRCVTLTQWSRACKKSKSSSVQSSSVLDLEPTLVSQISRRSLACTQCSVCSHFARITSKGSWKTFFKHFSNLLK